MAIYDAAEKYISEGLVHMVSFGRLYINSKNIYIILFFFILFLY